MDRLPEHLEADPYLRPEFIDQESLDEFTERILGQSGSDPSETTDAEHASMYSAWFMTLDPETNFMEFHYLMGFTDFTSRVAAMDRSFAIMRNERAIANAGNN